MISIISSTTFLSLLSEAGADGEVYDTDDRQYLHLYSWRTDDDISCQEGFIDIAGIPEVLGKFSSDIVVEGSSGSVFTVALFAEWFSGEHSESFPSESIWDCALKTSGFKIFLIISSWSHHGTIVGYVIPDTFSR